MHPEKDALKELIDKLQEALLLAEKTNDRLLLYLIERALSHARDMDGTKSSSPIRQIEPTCWLKRRGGCRETASQRRFDPMPVQTPPAEIVLIKQRDWREKAQLCPGPPRAAPRLTSPEPKTRDHLASDHIAEGMLAHTIARGAGDDHERQKVLLARMAGAR